MDGKARQADAGSQHVATSSVVGQCVRRALVAFEAEVAQGAWVPADSWSDVASAAAAQELRAVELLAYSVEQGQMEESNPCRCSCYRTSILRAG